MMSTTNSNKPIPQNPASKNPTKKKKPMMALVYISLLIGGIIIIFDMMAWFHMNRWTAQIGFALVSSAVVLLVGNGRPSGIIGAIVIWIGAIIAMINP